MSIVDESIANDFLEKLQRMDDGEHATLIGEVVDNHPKQVLSISGLGGKRVVNMLTGEQLPRIC